jgi:hypothetical protein
MDRTFGLLLVYATVGAFPQTTSAQGRGTAERDSAGVRIITERPRAPVSLANARPLFIVDGSEHGRDPFFRNLEVVALPDGFVVAVGGTSDLRFYGLDGTPQNAVGRRGGGPGEFRSISAIQTRSDSIVVYDGSLRRISVWSLRGEHLRDEQVAIPRTSPAGALAATAPGVLGVLPDGGVLYVSGARLHPGQGLQRAMAAVVRTSRGSERHDTLKQLPVMDYQQAPSGSGGPTRSVAFPRWLAWSVGVGGFALSDGAEYQIDQYAPTGQQVRSIRVERRLTPVAAKDREAVLSKQSQQPAPDIVFSTVFPAYTRMWHDRTGRLWAELYRPPTATAGFWDVFDRNGRLLATVEAPAALRLVAADAARIYAIHTDELDVQTIRAFAAPAVIGGR